jgi:hypothetical protein
MFPLPLIFGMIICVNSEKPPVVGIDGNILGIRDGDLGISHPDIISLFLCVRGSVNYFAACQVCSSF